MTISFYEVLVNQQANFVEMHCVGFGLRTRSSQTAR